MKGCEDAMRVAYLYFEMQHYKKELRLQLVEDIARMKAEGASPEELIARVTRHDRTRRVMRDAFDEVADNPRSRMNPSYDILIELCDEYGIGEFKELLLHVRPMNADEISQAERRRIMIEDLDTFHSRTE
jgi:hypothetical protein